jgi:hypothetical protein
MTNAALPGQQVDLPLPPELTATLGYRSDARFVGFFWSPLGDQLVATDGVNSGTAQSWAYLAYRRHRAVAPLLAPFDLGSSEEDGTHMLLIDRGANRASVAPVTEARAFLEAQHPPAPDLTPEEQERFNRELERLMEEWRNRPIGWDEINRQQREQSTRMAVMLAFLDQQVPLSQGEGQSP